MHNGLFAQIISFPNPESNERYLKLVGLDQIKERLEKEAETLVRPDLLERWSIEHHGSKLPALNLLLRRPPLFVFAGDVGTGKTELAMTFGDQLARGSKMPVQLFSLSLSTRGSGAVGEMTKLITDAFAYVKANCPKSHIPGKKPQGAVILLIDEADALAQSREMVQMHHEDRAGVNALIRGIDELANAKLPCLIIMCSNRLEALDPAVMRRAAAIFEFNRPSKELRSRILEQSLSGSLDSFEIEKLADSLGETKNRKYGFTFSDLTQRLIPSIILAAYPNRRIDGQLAFDVAAGIAPTPPFKAKS